MGERAKIEEYIRTWEKRCYPNGIPDEVDYTINHLVPSYKKIAICILKNDYEEIGYIGKESIYYGILKRIELQQRNQTIQLRLFP